MPFGVCGALEEFERHVNETMEGSEGVTTIPDNLLVTGARDTFKEALIERNRNLITLFTQCREGNCLE